MASLDQVIATLGGVLSTLQAVNAVGNLPLDVVSGLSGIQGQIALINGLIGPLQEQLGSLTSSIEGVLALLPVNAGSVTDTLNGATDVESATEVVEGAVDAAGAATGTSDITDTATGVVDTATDVVGGGDATGAIGGIVGGLGL